MHRKWFIPVLIAAPFAALADGALTGSEFASPPYQMLRFNENYAYLTDPAKRRDALDLIKYIPLRTNEPSWYLTLGGEVRERFEGAYDPNFGIKSSPNSQWLQRITLLSDVHLGERIRFFAEGISGLIDGESKTAPPVQDDPLDLAYAFADVVPYLSDDERLTLRVGRFGMMFGSGRLVATRAFAAAPNIPFRFDGFELLYVQPQWSATTFLTRPVEDNGGISGSNPGIAFWGLYVTRWFDAAHRSGVDIYYFGDANEKARYASGTADEHRHSFGIRNFGQWKRWDWNMEDVIQVGSFGSESILAWTASLDTGYTWDVSGQPRLGLKADVISGNTDNGKQGTFNSLYPNPNYFNDASLVRPANLIDIHPNLTVNPTRNVSIYGGADVFWRYSRSDAVYNPPGGIAVPALKNEPAFIGTGLDINLQWKIQRHVTFLASYVHSFTSEYVRAAGGRDGDYVSTALSFVF